MNMVFRQFLCVFLFFAATLFSEIDHVRQVQEALRKRNLFFGDIDGRVTPQLTGALKRYQSRKGFEVTGNIDPPTAASLQIGSAGTLVAAESQISAREQMQTQGSNEAQTASQPAGPMQADAASATKTEPDSSPLAATDLPIIPEPPAEAPSTAQDLTPERVNTFVETYLADGETDDIGLQVWFYRFPVHYFQHGLVDQNFVFRDTQAYVKRWPQRQYRLAGPVTFTAGANENETLLEFTIDYTVRNRDRVKSGRTKNFWTVQNVGEEMKITAIREEHIR